MFRDIRADTVIVGGGIFGCLAAIELAQSGLDVVLCEARSGLIQEASLNNQNRLHLGYHYPRDLETGKQCMRGFWDFKRRYKDAILDGFTNIYAISEFNSQVDFGDFLAFCKQLSLPADVVDLEKFSPHLLQCEGAIFTQEAIYDSAVVAQLVMKELSACNVRVLLNSRVTDITETDTGFSVEASGETISCASIVNCGYASVNEIDSFVADNVAEVQYELTVVPIINWREGLPPIGITVLDGPFFTVLPFGKTGDYLLYHVEHTVTERHIGYNFPKEWNRRKDKAHAQVGRGVFNDMVESASAWLPDIERADYNGCLATVRATLPYVDSTDQRPSIIRKLPTKHPFFSVFSGKIDHSIWVARDLRDKVVLALSS